MMMRSGGNIVVEVIEVRGLVWEPPHDIAQALGDDPRLSDCLLFHLQHMFFAANYIGVDELEGVERWEHKYRINEKDDQTKEVQVEKDELLMMSDQTRVLFVEEVKYYSENNKKIDDDDDINNEVASAAAAAAPTAEDHHEVVKITLPATHLFLLPELLESGEIEHLRQVVMRLNLESIVTLGLPHNSTSDMVVALSDQLLASPTQSLRLQHLYIIFGWYTNVAKEEELVESVVHMCLSLHLEGLMLHYPPQSMQSSEVTLRLSNSSQRSQLSYLGITDKVDSAGVQLLTSTAAQLLSGLKQFKLAGYQSSKLVSELGAASAAASLQRLDLRGCRNYVESEDINLLLRSIFMSSTQPTISLSDLGLDIDSIDSMKLLVTSPALANLLILRLVISGDKQLAATDQLAQDGLSRSDCKVKFLDLQLRGGRAELSANFWHSLRRESSCSRKTNLIQGLRIIPQSSVRVRGGLADWLRSPECSLVWLDCRNIIKKTTFADEQEECEKEELELANSLTNNFSLCTLSIEWKSLAAKAHASSLMRRNRVYKAGQLLEEDQVEPNGAKLFLCGHGTVGKTTLCQTLLRTQRSKVVSSPLIMAPCGRLLGAAGPERTRGMEFHSLSFNNGRDGRRSRRHRLVICDLAGQDEFHAFHHYFMNASNNDLFIVVCKLERVLLQGVFQRQLEYWLRFIVSHRSASAMDDPAYRPKVIVAVNFFYTTSLEAMCAIAIDKTHAIMEKFSRKLDFGPRVEVTSAGGGTGRTHVMYRNLFAIYAHKIGQVDLLRERLQSLLEELLQRARPIPKLCNDISTRVLPPAAAVTRKPAPFLNSPCLPLRFASDQAAKAQLFLPFSKVLERYCQMFPDCIPPNYTAPPKYIVQRIEAALMELHNAGLLVYFPTQKSNGGIQDELVATQEHADNLVITNSGWFCNKLIGNLLGTNLQSRSRSTNDQVYPNWLWKIQDIKQMLRDQDCKEEHLEKIIHYLQDLDLCFPTQDDTNSTQANNYGHEALMILFPTLLQQKEIRYPQVISEGASSSHMREVFFGRRLRCEDSSLHLIPSGVFTRLQVRLQRLCDNNAYALGDGWASFMKGNVGAVVRFGGERDEYAAENKQWIDTLIFIPISVHSQQESHNSSTMLAGDRLMTRIRSLIYDICQAADFRGIPTVTLQEWVLKSKDPSSPAIELSTILKKVREEGLEENHVAWPWHSTPSTPPSTPAMELLLPKELQEHVDCQLTALAKIKEEFSLATTDGDEKMAGYSDHDNISTSDPQDVIRVEKGKDKVRSEFEDIGANVALTGEWLQCWRLLEKKLDNLDKRQESLERGMQKRFDNLERGINLSLQMIREDIRSLGECLRLAEKNIIVNCSTRLLRNELKKDRAHPLYPYLVDSEGKLKALRSLFRQRARLHFMCESPTDGPHPVEGQKGKEVTIKVEKWLIQTARVMLPAFRVLCCMARLAAAVYLPSAHVFIPAPDCFDALGLERESLQHEILPKALEALLKEVPTNMNPRRMIQQNEVKEAIKGILENESIDMAADFSLHRVSFNESGEEVCWVCDKHKGAGQALQPISNPFN